ncbi:hypothetical protein HGT71_07495 [Rosenbergiella epipactidis]|uniref:hypothetical protein n=1 Tax=Rosenbergiella epipactidis TaxID=1544694 RepID=UPI001BDB18D2|nr:hypothetical protein [Rosenbergiella epipactidis]MBT0718111.1 hypothetical protein [Rosenbergiella epipactidis]
MDRRIEIVNQAIELANRFYQQHGYVSREGFKFWQSPHPQERLMFEMACAAFDFLKGTEVMDIVNELEEEGLL